MNRNIQVYYFLLNSYIYLLPLNYLHLIVTIYRQRNAMQKKQGMKVWTKCLWFKVKTNGRFL
jgi:hypothetical protein